MSIFSLLFLCYQFEICDISRRCFTRFCCWSFIWRSRSWKTRTTAERTESRNNSNTLLTICPNWGTWLLIHDKPSLPGFFFFRGRVITKGAPPKNYELWKEKSQVFIEFPFIWLSNVKFVAGINVYLRLKSPLGYSRLQPVAAKPLAFPLPPSLPYCQ